MLVDSRSRRILSIESEHTPSGSSIFDELGGWSLTDTARNNIHDLGVSIDKVMAAIETGEWLPTEQMRTLCRTTNLDVIISESTSVIIAVLPAGESKALSSVVPRAVGAGAAVGIASTSSDKYRGFRNAVMEIRSRFGIDLREH